MSAANAAPSAKNEPAAMRFADPLACAAGTVVGAGTFGIADATLVVVGVTTVFGMLGCMLPTGVLAGACCFRPGV